MLRIDRELSLLEKRDGLVLGVVPDRASIYKYDHITIGGLDQLDDFVTDMVLGLRVVLWGLEVERRQQTLARDPLVDDIGRQHEVGGASVDNSR